jgi:hypothetical protein
MPKFTFLQTRDLSPSLRIGEGDTSSEAMHSPRGAFSETVYIYGAAIEMALEKKFRPRVLSLGLGIGYNELLATALFLKHAPSSSGLLNEVGGESFELLPELRQWFVNWIQKEGEVPLEFTSTYNTILSLTAAETGIAADEITDLFCTMLQEERWLVSGALDTQTEFLEQFGAICFDPFSSKSSPELWNEEFLTKFFNQAAAPGCVVSTYACTGALKRALRATGFELNIRHGFATKRDSTFACRTPSF